MQNMKCEMYNLRFMIYDLQFKNQKQKIKNNKSTLIIKISSTLRGEDKGEGGGWKIK